MKLSGFGWSWLRRCCAYSRYQKLYIKIATNAYHKVINELFFFQNGVSSGSSYLYSYVEFRKQIHLYSRASVVRSFDKHIWVFITFLNVIWMVFQKPFPSLNISIICKSERLQEKFNRQFHQIHCYLVPLKYNKSQDPVFLRPRKSCKTIFVDFYLLM